MLVFDVLIERAFHAIALATSWNGALVEPGNLFGISSVSLFSFIVEFKWHVQLVFVTLFVSLNIKIGIFTYQPFKIYGLLI